MMHRSLMYVFFLLALLGCGRAEQPDRDLQTVRESIPQPKWIPDTDPELLSPEADEESKYFVAQAVSESQKDLKPDAPLQRVYRPDDTRVPHDEARLRDLGIEKYESQRLRLYTDIDPDIAKTLPPLIDQAFDTLVDYFGPPPPARSGAEFQMTGYLIGDRDRFQAAGLIPVELNRFDHGQHRGQEFWMYEQEYYYYRRHLLIHEVTHCFMLITPGIHPPIWYLEGMAELFATHRVDENGSIEFGVMPGDPQDFVGFSRVEMLQEEVLAGRFLNLDQTTAIGEVEFAASRSIPYAWSWALCKFLDAHPRYQKRFRKLGQHLVGKEFFRLANTMFTDDKIFLAAEWDQFIQRIEYGWDFSANAFVLTEEETILSTAQPPRKTKIQASRGWQSSGIQIIAGETYPIVATGTVVLAKDPKPWISEPQGISIQYAAGKPIGRLAVGVLISASSDDGIIKRPFEVQDCGRGNEIRFASSGTLFFLINDHGSDRQNNSGTYEVQVSRPE